MEYLELVPKELRKSIIWSNGNRGRLPRIPRQPETLRRPKRYMPDGDWRKYFKLV